jgi:hypothetical protein
MATSIFFNGKRINVPGAYSKVDASALASTSPSAVGIVALLGTAEGGKPLSVDEVDSDMTRGGQVLDHFRSGDLRVASQFAFEPSTDEAIPGGAQRVVAVKVNPATQSTATLQDDSPADAADLTSTDYGLFTEQINITIADGTAQGKLITIAFEDVTEVFDDVGGDAAFDVLYTPGADGYDSMSGVLSATQFTAAGSKGELGLVAEVASAAPAGFPSVADVASSAAGDTTQTITLYGLDGSGAAQFEVISLNGTTNVQGTLTWTKILGAVLSAAAVGTITVSDFPVVTTVLTLAPAALTAGVVEVTNAPVEGVVTATIDTDDAHDIALFGETVAGVTTGEVFDMTAANTTPVVGTVTMRKVTIMALGESPGARTITFTANAAQTAHSTFATVQKLVDKLNTLDGFTATGLVSNPTTFLLTDMDFAAASDLLTPAAEFYADLYAFIAAINQGSAYITAARATSASAVPANTTSPVFLSGGIEGVATASEWQSALDLLRGRRVNIIVPLTSDAAIHTLVATHLVERAGTLRSEANGWVGLGTVGDAGDTLANIKSRNQVLGTRHLSSVPQECQRPDPDTAVSTWWPPYIYAAIHAGMQAGSPIGEPLTHKRPLITDVRQDSSWSPTDDQEVLIDAGAVITEKVDNVGLRIVRSVTTHLADDNVVFTEMSANESANAAVFELRTALEAKIGQRGLAGTVAALKGLANDVLGRLVDDEIIVAYRNLQVEQVGDVFPISVEISPVLPINFVPITVHLVATQLAA